MLNKNSTRPFCFLFFRKKILLYAVLLFSLNVTAQINVTIKVTSVPSAFKNEPVYIPGSFNGWNVDMQQLSNDGTVLTTEIKIPDAGNYEFKFVREGSWNSVECDSTGRDIGNRSFYVSADTVIVCTIAGWKDDEASFGSFHTASKNVSIASESFFMPEISAFRKIWIYLPPDYYKSKKHYPVMYMHDGQNIFDNINAFAGEWGVDECIDSLVALGKPGCIVVAIENGNTERMSEYNPFEFTWRTEKDTITFQPKADYYLTDIVGTLKPFIDQQYRTLPSKENSIIAGSSMGGLISYYAAIKYPNVFGKAGIFSPAFWTASGIDSLTDARSSGMKGKYFFYMGGKEGGTYIDDMKRISGKIGRSTTAFVYSIIDPEAEHKEYYWRKWFAEFYNWVMADGYNVNVLPEN
jgi:predicted alpha/beta superfamily hydrolase